MTGALIYLDHNATTPVDPAVATVMRPYLEQEFGNPSSSHAAGRRARRAVQDARGHLATLLGARPGELVFTSGGSEANNLALFGVAWQRRDRGRHLITTAVEHPAVLEPCRELQRRGWELTVVPADGHGRVDPAAVAAAIRPDTVLASVMHANNEVGTIEPVAEIAAICRAHDVWLHTDAAQTVGKIPTRVDDLGADLLTVAGHKLYGPKGVGALYLRGGREVAPMILGAGHEGGRRAGTENVLQIVGLGEAARLAAARLDRDTAHARELRDRLLAGLTARLGPLPVHGDPDGGLPGTLSVSFPGVDAATLVARLGDRVAASPGAACHADGVQVSSVLTAMGVSPEVAAGTVRFSTGRANTAAQIDTAVELVAAAVAALRTGGG
jgi:cysteine desulfurase